jgi:hypothetical protein
VPTYDILGPCRQDWSNLNREQRRQFRRALAKFLQDLPTHHFRAGLRVRDVEGHPGVWEMTWAGEGRATFMYGTPVREGEIHIIWRRIGGHEIFDNP